MAYKRYIRKNGKVYGPYVYHSRKKGGKVISEYRGKAIERKKVSLFGFLIMGVILLLSLAFILNYNPYFKTSINPLNALTGFIISENLDNISSGETLINETQKENQIIIYNINESINVSTGNISISINELSANLTENITNITTEVNINIKTTQYQAVLGQPVKWKKYVQLEKPGKAKIRVPREATNIVVNNTLDKQSVRFSITGAAISERTNEPFLLTLYRKIFGALTGRVVQDTVSQEKEIEIDDNEIEYNIEYETPAPYAIEEDTRRGKRVKIIGPETVHYENIISFTYLDESLDIKSPSQVKIYWIENKSYVEIQTIKDADENGIYDYIEWITPHLSNQTFDIIAITKAEHLDPNRNFISDIYGEVRELDDIWSETIPSEDYVRVTFEQNLTNENDITIYPRIVSGTPRVEVYEVDGNELIAEFTNMISNQYNKVFLTNLQGTQDTFDLRILDGSVEIDHIVDPASAISYTINTPSPNPTESNSFTIQIDASCSSKTGGCEGNIEIRQDVQGGGCSPTTVMPNDCTGNNIRQDGWTDLLTGGGCTFTQTDSDTMAYVCASGETGSFTANTFACASSAATYEIATVTTPSVGGSIEKCMNVLTIDTADNPPTWPNPSVNDSTPDPTNSVRHNIYWSDDNTMSYATLEINSTGASCNTAANVTSTTLSLANEWANLTWQVPNECEGKTIGWKQYANDSADKWNVTDLQTYTVNNIAPTTSFGTNPVDTYNRSSQSITFDLKVSDNLNVNGLQLWGNWTGTWGANQTNSSPINDTYWNITVNNIPEGNNHVWAAWGNDTLGNANFTGTNRTFTVDLTAPSLSNEGANETDISQNEVFCLNITATDSGVGVDTVYAEVWNTTNWVNYSMSEDGTSCDGTPSDGIYGVEILGTTTGLWNYSATYANDTLNNWNSYDFTDKTINVTAPADTYYPQFSNFQEYLTNDSDYSSGQNYQFNSTVTNTNGTIFLSFSGANYSATNDTATNFYVDFGSLSAGTYNYFWWGYGNGSNKNYNSSSSRAYSVAKITPVLTKYLNGADANEIVTYPIGINASASTTGGTANIYRNGTDITSDNNVNVTLAANYYEYEFNITGNTNYSDVGSVFLYATVSQNTGSCSVLFNESSSGITYGTPFKVWSNCTSTATLYRNSSAIDNNSEQNLAASSYNFTVIRTDNVNYSNIYDEQNFVVDQATGEVATYIDNTRNNKSILLYLEKYLNATLITGQAGSTINLYYNDSLINQGASPLSNLTNFTSEGEFNVSGIYAGNENYTYDIETWWVTVSSDSAPTLTLNSPVDYDNSSSTSITFNCTADDDIGLINVSLYGNWSGWHLNETNDTGINNANYIFSKTISEGIYVWNCYACDSIYQCSFDSANYTFIVDSTYPTFSGYARNPSPPNEDQNVQVNVTVTETNPDTIILEWNGTTNYTVTTSNGDEYYFTITNGNYTAHDSVTYYWYANDTSGNLNKSAQQSFTVANQAPSLTVNEPDGSGDDTKTTFTVTWTASDNDAEDVLTTSCYGDADGSDYDKTYTCFTGTTNDGSESCDVSSWTDDTYYIWCNATDTYTGTPDYSPGELTVDKTGPSVGSEGKDKTPNED